MKFMHEIVHSPFTSELMALADLEYKAFNQKLLPNIDQQRIMGIRIPLLREFAQKVGKFRASDCCRFIQLTPHYYLEENHLHAFLLESVHDYHKSLLLTEEFLPFIDNWQTCDSYSPKIFKQHLDELLSPIEGWLGSSHCYTIRFGIGNLLRYYLDERFRPKYLHWVGAVSSGEYYVNMMRAWYFSIALIKQPTATLPIFQAECLDSWTHNKALQKAIESRRTTLSDKALYRRLKRKV